MTQQQYRYRKLNYSDANALRSFECAEAGHWAIEIQEAIRTEVADRAIAAPYGHGAFFGTKLVGVSTWEIAPENPKIWRSSIIAVHREHRRQGIATTLKKQLLALARQAGAVEVWSKIDFDNDAMMLLNSRLGARTTPRRTTFGPARFVESVIKVGP